MQKCLLFLLLLTSKTLFSQVNDTKMPGRQISGSSKVSEITKVGERQSHLLINSSDQQVYLLNPPILASKVAWDLVVEHKTSSGSYDQARIYLFSDREDLAGALNGYYIQINEGNGGVSYTLHRQHGGTVAQIITGTQKILPPDNIWKTRIHVSKDEKGFWELKTAAGTDSTWIFEGSTSDSTFTKGSYFGMLCKYTNPTSERYAFRDITVESSNDSHESPRLISITVLDSITLQLNFNKAIDAVTARNRLSYSFNNGLGNPDTIYLTNDASVFHLKFSEGLKSGDYILSVSGLRDTYNQPLPDNSSLSFSYKKPDLVTEKDLIINEIFADPGPQIDLPSVEFVEILNTTGGPINLKDWYFCDAVSKSRLPEYVLKGGEYLVLCAKTDTTEYKVHGRTLGISPWPSLNNTGDNIKLVSPEGITIDSVSYTDAWYQNPVKKQGGWTLERIDPASSCEGIYNWIVSEDPSGGTPGRVNSVYHKDFDQLALKADSIRQISDTVVAVFFNKPLSGTIQSGNFSITPFNNLKQVQPRADWKKLNLVYEGVFKGNVQYELAIDELMDCSGKTFSTGSSPLTFRPEQVPTPLPVRVDTANIYITEIFADPSPEVGLPLVEFIELHNPGMDTVDLDEWSINDISTRGIIERAKILPGQFAILCPLADTAEYQPFGKVIGISPWPALNNSADQIVLRSHTKRTVDSIAYSDSWYRDRTKKQGGWTLERIFNENTCSGFYNWNASNADTGGTPGKANSVFESRPVLRIKDVVVLSDSTVNVVFNTVPDTSSLTPSYFSLNQGIGNAIAASTKPEDPSVFTLNFNARLLEGVEYLLTINSLKTCSGNQIVYPDNSYTFKIPPAPHYLYPIVINEIFADPSPVIGIPEAEFVELYNATNKSVPLKGLIYEDSSNTRYQFSKGEIEANGYIILCAQKDTLNFKSFGKVLGINPWPVLNNDKDILRLKDNKGYEIHRVSYTNSWYKDKEKQQGGYSLEMINPSSACSGFQNWNSCVDPSGGTPGKKNSILLQSAEPQPLKLLLVTITDSLTLTLNFNKSIDSLSASDISNYSINNGLSTPVSASPLSPDFEKITLRFTYPISRGKNYQITVTNLTDCAGSGISSDGNSAEFMYAEQIEKGDIVINEILFNPRPNGVDFVEVYNNSSKTVDLKDLAIATTNQNDSLVQVRILKDSTFLFEPKEYLVLTSDPNNIRSEYLTEAPDAFLKLTSLPSFNDDSGVVVLVTGASRIDQLNYSAKMHIPLLKNAEGVSLERSSLKAATNEIGNFRSAAASVGFATPAYKNSQYVEENDSRDEVTFISKTFSPDNDGFEDALYLSYHFKEAGMIANAFIYNDQGVLIKRLTKNQSLAAEGIIPWDGMNEVNEKAPVGIYLIYLEVFDLKGQVKKYRKNFVLASKF